MRFSHNFLQMYSAFTQLFSCEPSRFVLPLLAYALSSGRLTGTRADSEDSKDSEDSEDGKSTPHAHTPPFIFGLQGETSLCQISPSQQYRARVTG